MKLVAVIGPSRVTIMLYEEMLMDHGARKGVKIKNVGVLCREKFRIF